MYANVKKPFEKVEKGRPFYFLRQEKIKTFNRIKNPETGCDTGGNHAEKGGHAFGYCRKARDNCQYSESGVRKVTEGRDGTQSPLPAVAYPEQVLSNTWDLLLAGRMGACLADDCIEADVDVLLAPGVNIKRSAYCGRNFEYFSEDPFLTGVMAGAYITGLQEHGVGACIKHFCANNLEFDRMHQSSDVDERTLREIYYRPFEIACTAQPVAVMCAYNRVNGVYAAEYKKGYEVLRTEFGLDGAIVSDWGAVRDRTASARAGLDLEMPFSSEHFQKLEQDAAVGKLSVRQIDACAGRILSLAARCSGMKQRRQVCTQVSECIAVSRQIAAEGAVLLKNDGILPLQKGCSLSVCGCYAKPDSPAMMQGRGAAEVNAKDWKFDLPQALHSRTGGEVLYEGAFHYDGVDSACQNIHTAKVNAALSEVNIVCVGTGGKYEYEAGDRQTLRLPAVQEFAIRETAAVNPRTVVVIFAGAAIDTSAWEDCACAILFAGFNGSGGDEAVADLLTGILSPCGKLTETFVREASSPPVPRTAGVTRYAEGLDVGYRYFQRHPEGVCYPFGHGLGYAHFDYGNLSLECRGDLQLDVSYDIGNSSTFAGKEISQVYVRPVAPFVYRPEQELKGFSKDEIAAGKSVRVCIKLDRMAFSYWSAANDAWTVDDGVYEIRVGASSADIRLCGRVRICGGKLAPCP